MEFAEEAAIVDFLEGKLFGEFEKSGRGGRQVEDDLCERNEN